MQIFFSCIKICSPNCFIYIFALELLVLSFHKLKKIISLFSFRGLPLQFFNWVWADISSNKCILVAAEEANSNLNIGPIRQQISTFYIYLITCVNNRIYSQLHAYKIYAFSLNHAYNWKEKTQTNQVKVN